MTNPEFPDGEGGCRGTSANLKVGVRRPIILAIFPEPAENGKKWTKMGRPSLNPLGPADDQLAKMYLVYSHFFWKNFSQLS